jgi:hypothetical protein
MIIHARVFLFRLESLLVIISLNDQKSIPFKKESENRTSYLRNTSRGPGLKEIGVCHEITVKVDVQKKPSVSDLARV